MRAASYGISYVYFGSIGLRPALPGSVVVAWEVSFSSSAVAS